VLPNEAQDFQATRLCKLEPRPGTHPVHRPNVAMSSAHAPNLTFNRARRTARVARALGRDGHALRALATGLLVILAGAQCSRDRQRGLTLAGSTSLQPFAETWADAFQVQQPELPIHIQGGGSTTGVQAAMSGAAQIGMSSRPLTEVEATRVEAIPVARDAIAVVVHPTLPAADLRLDQIRAIYAGRIKNWRSVSTRNAPITVITREEGSGTRAAFEALAMSGERIASSALVQDSTGGVRQMVASDPAAIGYVSIGLVDASVKALRVDGVELTEANVDRGAYPLVRPFLFVVAAKPQGAAKQFIDWITGPEGRALTRREGLLPPAAR
jgi:phosphate transport system substrate-binding protein